MNLAMQKLFTGEQWQEIEKEAKFRTVTIDSKTNTPVCLEDIKDLSYLLNEDQDKLERTVKRDFSVDDIEFQIQKRVDQQIIMDPTVN